jgi:DnaJ-class molecular chaperone
LHEEWDEEFEGKEHSNLDHFGPGPFRRECAFCKGTGVHPGTMLSLTHDHCPTCRGTGLLEFKGNRKDFNPCGRCGGTGREGDLPSVKQCRTCQGRGLI